MVIWHKPRGRWLGFIVVLLLLMILSSSETKYSLRTTEDAVVGEVVARNTLDEVVVVTVANYGMREMVLNWIESLHRTGIQRFIVFCLDSKVHELLTAKGFAKNAVRIPQSWSEDFSAEFAEFGKGDYNGVMFTKIQVVLNLLSHYNVSVVYSDVDIVFLSSHILGHLQFDDPHRVIDFRYMVDDVDQAGNRQSQRRLLLARPTRPMISMFQNVLRLEKFQMERSRHDQLLVVSISISLTQRIQTPRFGQVVITPVGGRFIDKMQHARLRFNH
jgi:hypothetical protein